LLLIFDGLWDGCEILTQRLRELETAGILHRSSLLEGRVKVVEYSLTGWGMEVMKLVNQLHEWDLGHKAQIARHPASGSRVKSS
jgi:DNA-binding HxlR family transcriptional regulator